MHSALHLNDSRSLFETLAVTVAVVLLTLAAIWLRELLIERRIIPDCGGPDRRGPGAQPGLVFERGSNATRSLNRLALVWMHRLAQWLAGAKHNVGSCDCVVRLLTACVILIGSASDLPGTLPIGVVLLNTAIFQYCPLWAILRIDTTAFDRQWWEDSEGDTDV